MTADGTAATTANGELDANAVPVAAKRPPLQAAPGVGAPTQSAEPTPGPQPLPRGTDELIAQLRDEIEQLQSQLAEQRDRAAQLEADLADERARREQEAQATIGRQRDLTSMASGLAEAEQALATGSGDVSRVLARAQAMAAAVATSAGAAGATQQAALAYEAQRWIAASQDALSRADFFQARQAVQLAGAAAVRARALASSPATDASGSY